MLNNVLRLGYMLEPDSEKRPDIFQVSGIAFPLLNKENPVQNLHVRISNTTIINMIRVKIIKIVSEITDSEFR